MASRLRIHVVVGNFRAASISKKASAGRNPLTAVEFQPVRGCSRSLTFFSRGSWSTCNPICSKPSRYALHACSRSCGMRRVTSSVQIACCSGVYAAQSCSIK